MDILDEFLIKSLKNQSVEYELILIDNTKGRFSSAAEALNDGGSKAKGDYIMFVHQDVDLKSDTWLEDAEKIMNSLDNLGIAGVAGRIKNKKGTITNMEDGTPPTRISESTVKVPVKVQTLDECLFIIPKNLFDSSNFDEKTCDDWHLYAVDYSLNAKRSGFDVYVIPSFIYHRSPGYSYSEGFDSTLSKILKKYEKDYKVISTSMGDWVTFYPLKLQKLPLLNRITRYLLKKLQ
ncbi:Glycosyltransferase like family protein [anaerobic digester metagenome]